MATKNGINKKGGFALAPITLSEPVKATDGFTNLVETVESQDAAIKKSQAQRSQIEATKTTKLKTESAKNQNEQEKIAKSSDEKNKSVTNPDENRLETGENAPVELSLTKAELLKILDADSFDEIYELTDVLRASSLKLYATLIGLADSRGRARAKNHELMSKAGIKGIATLYKQERWLMDLKLLEKKAKPGPHDGSSYVVRKLESLPLPEEIIEKFNQFLAEREGLS